MGGEGTFVAMNISWRPHLKGLKIIVSIGYQPNKVAIEGGVHCMQTPWNGVRSISEGGKTGGTDMIKHSLALGQEAMFCSSLWWIYRRLCTGLHKPLLFSKLDPLAIGCICHRYRHKWGCIGVGPGGHVLFILPQIYGRVTNFCHNDHKQAQRCKDSCFHPASAQWGSCWRWHAPLVKTPMG